MTKLARLGLRLLTLAVPSVLAACYGPSVLTRGQVIDSETKEGIEGISVSCEANSSNRVGTRTGTGGYFQLDYVGECETLVAEDVDGELRGSYQRAEVKSPGSVEVVIEMAKVP